MTRKPRTLQQALDKAVKAENARYLSDRDRQAQDIRDANRWVRWTEAERVAGPEAVVLPLGLAQEIMRVLRDEPTRLAVSPDVIRASLQRLIDQAAERA